ncbi:DUF6268 family outer membrane beta-barrel protein [Prevotella pallens]|uniref:DUF6268 family outer membrane beta-barrel protein n=1 Tax=Prevotella pallens TaxID=60133 RepID=UPI001CAB9450|nr:DUF6268 family outer membrane beta-barrel protein [Prevotella pallens]MBF1473091.1 hypothetical protein [Prevotella pallens]MBF1517087.1 hypothetical protein [Prevotella pallens]
MSGQYVKLNNHEGVCEVNPSDVLNLNFNVSHRRPLLERWYMLASLGVGVYSSPNEIAFRSFLVNGGVIFAYKCRNNLDIGIGAGITNSYGVPIPIARETNNCQKRHHHFFYCLTFVVTFKLLLLPKLILFPQQTTTNFLYLKTCMLVIILILSTLNANNPKSHICCFLSN